MKLQLKLVTEEGKLLLVIQPDTEGGILATLNSEDAAEIRKLVCILWGLGYRELSDKFPPSSVTLSLDISNYKMNRHGGLIPLPQPTVPA